MIDPTKVVEVVQADRDAARLLRNEIQRQLGPRYGLGTIEDADFDVQSYARHRLTYEAAQSSRIRELTEALEPFVDLGPQKGAWGVISKGLDGMAPLTVTVTKAQMQTAFAAVTSARATLVKENRCERQLQGWRCCGVRGRIAAARQ